MQLQGKTALITGASKGIGLAIAELFAANGANLILLSRDEEALRRHQERLTKQYNIDVATYTVDITSLDLVKSVFASINEQKRSFEIIVNNAGVMLDAPLLMLKPDVLHQNIATNIYGSFYVTQQAVKTLIKKRGGSVINLTSIVGVEGSAGQSAYAAAKSGVIGFTRSLSKELAPLHIRVNAIAPGFIDTDLTAGLETKIKEKTLANIGMKRAGTATEVAQVALFLASDNSSYVTGQIIGVDGGMVI